MLHIHTVLILHYTLFELGPNVLFLFLCPFGWSKSPNWTTLWRHSSDKGANSLFPNKWRIPPYQRSGGSQGIVLIPPPGQLSLSTGRHFHYYFPPPGAPCPPLQQSAASIPSSRRALRPPLWHILGQCAHPSPRLWVSIEWCTQHAGPIYIAQLYRRRGCCGKGNSPFALAPNYSFQTPHHQKATWKLPFGCYALLLYCLCHMGHQFLRRWLWCPLLWLPQQPNAQPMQSGQRQSSCEALIPSHSQSNLQGVGPVGGHSEECPPTLPPTPWRVHFHLYPQCASHPLLLKYYWWPQGNQAIYTADQ